MPDKLWAGPNGAQERISLLERPLLSLAELLHQRLVEKLIRVDFQVQPLLTVGYMALNGILVFREEGQRDGGFINVDEFEFL